MINLLPIISWFCISQDKMIIIIIIIIIITIMSPQPYTGVCAVNTKSNAKISGMSTGLRRWLKMTTLSYSGTSTCRQIM